MVNVVDIAYRFTTKDDNQKIYDFALRGITGTIIPKFAEDAGENLWERIEGGGYENVIVAEDTRSDDQVVGFIEVDPNRGISGETVYIRGIYVLDEYRRMGIGKKLLKLMVNEKAKRGEKLFVRAFTQYGLKFWENFGFKISHYSLFYDTDTG